MKGLGLEVYLPPTFNIETGKFEEPKLYDENGKMLDENEMDVFELARRRGTTVSGLKEMMNDEVLIDKSTGMQKHLTGQKHTKRDYERLKTMNIHEIVAKTR